jgi:two-component system NtrC family sensor kinase
MYLPATIADVHVEQKDVPVTQEVRSQKGTVLLVEDSNEVAAISAEYFRQLGYAVEHASNGADALRRLQQGYAYELVFSDILMPGSVAGFELARIVREYHSELPIILTTGYSEKAQEAVLEGFTVLQKPYDLEQLSKVIRELRTVTSVASSRLGGGSNR